VFLAWQARVVRHNDLMSPTPALDPARQAGGAVALNELSVL
jgi:hypothetical protein